MLFLMDPTDDPTDLRPHSRVFLASSAAAEAREANNGCSTEYTVGAGDVVEIASPVVAADDGSAAVYPNHLDCNISIGLDEAERSVFPAWKGSIYRNPT